jgi:hypothetical protein
MDFTLFVGTHHKTGTMWMFSIFQAFAERAGLSFLNFSEHCRALAIAEDRCDQLLFGYGLAFDGIILADHSEGFATAAALLPKERRRMFQVVRDPRDIAISAADCHVRSKERWLHMPQTEFGGMTYQERIASYPSLDDRVLFEIEHSSAATVHEIRLLTGIPGIEIFKIEDFILASETFRTLFDYCGFHKDYLQLFELAVNEHSFFGEAKAETSDHAFDARVEQWREKLTPTTLQAIEATFGDVIERLGYPSSSQ